LKFWQPPATSLQKKHGSMAGHRGVVVDPVVAKGHGVNIRLPNHGAAGLLLPYNNELVQR
jgi:hypothetical protein